LKRTTNLDRTGGTSHLVHTTDEVRYMNIWSC